MSKTQKKSQKKTSTFSKGREVAASNKLSQVVSTSTRRKSASCGTSRMLVERWIGKRSTSSCTLQLQDCVFKLSCSAGSSSRQSSTWCSSPIRQIVCVCKIVGLGFRVVSVSNCAFVLTCGSPSFCQSALQIFVIGASCFCELSFVNQRGLPRTSSMNAVAWISHKC